MNIAENMPPPFPMETYRQGIIIIMRGVVENADGIEFAHGAYPHNNRQ